MYRLFVVICLQRLVTSGSSVTNSLECRSNCRMLDTDLDSCWRQSLEFHTSELASSMQTLATAVLHINHWRNVHSVDIAATEPNDSATRVNTTFNAEQITSNGSRDVVPLSPGLVLEREVVDAVVSRIGVDSTVALTPDRMRRLLLLLVNLTLENKAQFETLSDSPDLTPRLPSLSCPIPCDYYPRMWIALFVVTAIALGLFALTVLLFFTCGTWWPYRKLQTIASPITAVDS